MPDHTPAGEGGGRDMATDTENLLVSLTGSFGRPDRGVDAALKEKVVHVLMRLVEHAAVDAGYRRRWQATHGIMYRESEDSRASAPCIVLYANGDGYTVQCTFLTEHSRSPEDWENHAQLCLFFTREELAEFFEYFDSTGLATYLTNQKLIAESTNMMRFDEAIETFIHTNEFPTP